VGVFLRVLEYQDSILFLTTNRPDDVDDAIASRCIAKLAYEVPDAADQARIWRVLADQAGVKLPDAMIAVIVAKNPAMSGRDVKNLLKLAAMMTGGDVTPEAVHYVRQFKATKDLASAGPVPLPGGIRRCPDCGVLIGRKGHTCPKAKGA
jgi:AAA+ superfamily predicted ATPase